MGRDAEWPEKPHSSSSAVEEGVSGFRKRRSTKVLAGLVRTRVEVGSKRVVGSLRGLLVRMLVV